MKKFDYKGLEIPEEIVNATIKVAEWFGMNGFGKRWAFLHICSRDYQIREEEMAKDPEGLDSLRLNFFEDHSRDFRYINGVSMDNSIPCWSVNLPSQRGRSNFKTLREAIDAYMNDRRIIV